MGSGLTVPHMLGFPSSASMVAWQARVLVSARPERIHDGMRQGTPVPASTRERKPS